MLTAVQILYCLFINPLDFSFKRSLHMGAVYLRFPWRRFACRACLRLALSDLSAAAAEKNFLFWSYLNVLSGSALLRDILDETLGVCRRLRFWPRRPESEPAARRLLEKVFAFLGIRYLGMCFSAGTTLLGRSTLACLRSASSRGLSSKCARSFELLTISRRSSLSRASLIALRVTLRNTASTR